MRRVIPLAGRSENHLREVQTKRDKSSQDAQWLSDGHPSTVLNVREIRGAQDRSHARLVGLACHRNSASIAVQK